MNNCTSVNFIKCNNLKVTSTEHCTGSMQVMLVYIRRLEHIQTPLSVGALETKPPHGTIYFMRFCGLMLLFFFKEMDLFLSSGADVTTGFPTLIL